MEPIRHNAFEEPAQPITGPGVIISGDKRVINYQGENYYRACGYPVHGSERCIKREGHFSAIHECMDGTTIPGE